MHITILFFFIVFSIAYLSGFFEGYRKANLSYNLNGNVALIEFLTQHKIKNKNYNRTPKEFSSYNKLLVGKKINNNAFFRYEYPLIEYHTGVFETTYSSVEISQYVDYYGLQDHLIIKTKDGYRLNSSISENEFMNKMNKDGWYFNSIGDAGVDYKYLVKKYSGFASSIAKQIYTGLVKVGKDTYFNRVQAALNFVQFIPYGRPDLDAHGWYYHEIGVPPEVFIMGYGDCDSKSVFFASILVNLIPLENIVLVECLVKSGNESTNGAHMMAAVSNLAISGESITFENNEYLLLETTTPIAIGKFDWESFQATSIIGLI
jgi:hypothetical protein